MISLALLFSLLSKISISFKKEIFFDALDIFCNVSSKFLKRLYVGMHVEKAVLEN